MLNAGGAGAVSCGGAWVHTHSTGAVLREAVLVVCAASERHEARLSVAGCQVPREMGWVAGPARCLGVPPEAP